jgi:hypothetical protein
MKAFFSLGTIVASTMCCSVVAVAELPFCRSGTCTGSLETCLKYRAALGAAGSGLTCEKDATVPEDRNLAGEHVYDWEVPKWLSLQGTVGPARWACPMCDSERLGVLDGRSNLPSGCTAKPDFAPRDAKARRCRRCDRADGMLALRVES